MLFVGFVGAALLVYEPALEGEFISDDQHYVRDNPYIHELSAEHLLEIAKPTGVLVLMVENYAPVHLLLHALEWQLFGEQVYGYHVVNVVLHALASLLLVLFFQRLGVPGRAAAVGGAIFLLHGANVEAVAWISQLKSSASLALAIGALLAQPRRPAVGTLLFALALLAKPSASFALPVAMVCTWLDPGARRASWAWLGAWGAIFAGFAVVELAAFARTAGQAPSLYADPWLRLRTSAAIGLRYLVMAASSYGLSSFHEPPASDSWLDPWWLGSVAVFGLLAWRIVVVVRARRPEAACWAWAASAYAPVCGVLALPYPMADRYLYAILPGLIGAALLGGGEALRRLEAASEGWGRDPGAVRRLALRAAALAAAFLLAVFALRAHERAAIWRHAHRVMADAERHYPEGTAAKTRQALRSARSGDIEAAVELLRAAHARGYNRLDQLLGEPAYAPYRDHPSFRALLVDIATAGLEALERNDAPRQLELRAMALAHEVRGETEAAIAALERALETGGPLDARIEQELAELRQRARLRKPTPRP